jgi:murein DD-endopeptidase MepM/ murein hydrolase activator NlpD
MWMNPTGKGIRQCDAQGCGHYGASRGNRKHTGVDYIADPEQPVRAVRSGTVTVVGYTYSDDLSFRYIAIKSDDGVVVRHLYVRPNDRIYNGAQVKAGEVIGNYQRLGIRFPGITEHVHIDAWEGNGTLTPWSTGGKSIDPTNLIPLSAFKVPLLGSNVLSVGVIAITLLTVTVSMGLV